MYCETQTSKKLLNTAEKSAELKAVDTSSKNIREIVKGAVFSQLFCSLSFVTACSDNNVKQQRNLRIWAVYSGSFFTGQLGFSFKKWHGR